MTTRSCLHQLQRHGALLSVAAALAMASPVLAQNTAPGSTGNAVQTEGGYSSWNFSESFGWQWFQFAQGARIRPLTFDSGLHFNFAFTEDVSKYFSLEEGFGLGVNKAEFLPFGLNYRATLPTRNYQASALGVLHFTPRDAKIRPFVVLGPAAVWYQPSNADHFSQPAGGQAIFPPNQLETKLEPGVIYGLGLKYNINRNFGLRTDLRGMWTLQPHLGIPNSSPTTIGTIYIPRHGTASALQLTAGIVFRFGYHAPPPPPAPPVVEAPKPVANIQIAGITGGHDVCPGENLQLHVDASGWLPEQTPTYQWFVNDQPAPGANSPNFSVPTADASGNRSIKVTVSAGESSKTSDTVSLRIKTLAPPTIRINALPASIAYGDKIPLSATATASECSEPATVRFTASEGSISGDTYDSSGVSFDMNNRLKQQSKAVTITASATDRLGKTATASSVVNVTLTPQAKRMDDIVFQSMSSRVNNCGKRILLEQVTPILRDDPNAKVILIGHRDTNERASSKVDEQRVLNSAAILSAGKGICPQLDLSRILINAAGTDQASETRPALCGSSVTERSGQAVRENDRRAQFRRVEVWVVPGGADMPAGTAGFQTAPQKETAAKGCPR